jgi:formiminoglutamate deiminase
MTTLHFADALLPGGWARDVRIEVDRSGLIALVETGAPADAAERLDLIAVPGLPNVHCHAFQRAMAGLTEQRGPGEDSFWSWRERMYQFLERIEPWHLEAIAALAYAEMLETGFTVVAEFHYLHHAPDGSPYADVGEMSTRVCAAAAQTGIGLTLLPVHFSRADFADRAPSPAQRRFVNDLDGLAAIAERARESVERLRRGRTGIAAHSLRTVRAAELEPLAALCPQGPVHIHVAEQQREVHECLAAYGARPVTWLLDTCPIDKRWCLVHATQMDATETARLAASGAVAGLCPVTEADLGDGIFPGIDYVSAGGCLGVGSDSNVQISASAELRLLEQSQRLAARRRNVLARPGESTGRALLGHALAGGARACAQPTGAIAPGHRADLVGLAPGDPTMLERRGDAWLDSWIFARADDLVREVWSAGRRVVRHGRHVARDPIEREYRGALRALLA